MFFPCRRRIFAEINQKKETMSRRNYIVWMSVLTFLAVMTVPYGLRMLGIIFCPARTGVLDQLELYLWCAAGLAAFGLLRRCLKANLEWIGTFTHELSHALAAMLMLRKVHSFSAGEREGMVETSGRTGRGLVPMSLAPYCLPIYTYLLLMLLRSSGLTARGYSTCSSA